MINSEDFIKNFKEQLVEPTSVKINESTEFRSLDQWDSLTAMAVQVMIADSYKVELSVDEFRSFNTIKDLIVFIEKSI